MPGVSPMILANDALRGDIRTEFLETLRRQDGGSSKLPGLMDMGIGSTQRTERYFYWESTPKPVRWRRGDPIPADGLLSRSYEIQNYTWARAIDWHEEDAEDDQTGSLTGKARMLAEEFQLLPERVSFQIMQGTTDPELLPSIPLAPDGAALFSATDGAGAARFGIAGGNIVTSTGVATSAAVRNDFYSAIERMMQFQGTNGEPFHAENFLDKGFLVIYGAQNAQVFQEAFLQDMVLQNGTGSAGVTNVVLAAGLSVTLWGTARLTGFNGFRVVSLGYPIKPLFQQVRLNVFTDQQDRGNSDRARDYRMNRFQAAARFGFGVNLPIGTVSVQ